MRLRPPSYSLLPKWRLPRSEAVTIIAGFKSVDGVVLCADTQETVGDLMKRHVPKLIFEPSESRDRQGKNDGNELAACFCGAGNGPFIDRLIDDAWEDAKDSNDLQQACEAIAFSIEENYRKYGSIYQAGHCPEVDILFGVKMYGGSRLFKATGPVVNEIKKYDVSGIGRYIADFLASRMYYPRLSINQCAILAAYILFQAKERIENCGGESHIAVLRNEGSSGRVDFLRVDMMTKLLRTTDEDIAQLLLKAADLTISDQEFDKKMNNVKTLLHHIRQSRRVELAGWEGAQEGLSGGTKLDSLGLPVVTDAGAADSQPSDGN
jgi:hypothetical protein